jgi:GGDEF domain-containing protein
MFENRPLTIAASVGLAVYPDDGDNPDVLLEHADQSMYAAKRRKKCANRESSG